MIDTSIIFNVVHVIRGLELTVGDSAGVVFDDKNGEALRYDEVAPLLNRCVFPIFRMLNGQEYTCKPYDNESPWWYGVIIERVA